MKNVFVLTMLTTALSITACSSSSMYQWGDYPDGLYRYYNKPETRDSVRARLVQHVQHLEQKKAIVPPGLYAEAGTYYLEEGDSHTALKYYKKEYAAWPESRAFMSALIANLEKLNNAN